MSGVATGESVTERVAALLLSFTAEQNAMTLSELSRHAGLPVSTAHRLVGELARCGLLERAGDGRYRVGLRLWEVASTATRAVDLRQAALPFLQELYAKTRENVQLAVLDGNQAVYIERISGPESVHIVSRVGGRLPVHATGVGLVLLAHSPAELQDEVLAAPLARFTRFTVTDPRRLRRMLSDVRRYGFVISDRQIETISVSAAAPIRDRGHRVVAALSVVASARGTDPRTFVPLVRSAAAAISRQLPIVTGW
jgi:DNA-binding IclR family transcriptional regulator